MTAQTKTYCIWQWDEITQQCVFLSKHDTERAAKRRIYDWVLWRSECKIVQTTETLH